jgi:hypothetical protein
VILRSAALTSALEGHNMPILQTELVRVLIVDDEPRLRVVAARDSG